MATDKKFAHGLQFSLCLRFTKRARYSGQGQLCGSLENLIVAALVGQKILTLAPRYVPLVSSKTPSLYVSSSSNSLL